MKMANCNQIASQVQWQSRSIFWPQQPRYLLLPCGVTQFLCTLTLIDNQYGWMMSTVAMLFRLHFFEINFLFCNWSYYGFLQDTHNDSQADDAYVSTILATSPPPDPLMPIPLVPRLKAEPQTTAARVSSLLKILVSLTQPQPYVGSCWEWLGNWQLLTKENIFKGVICRFSLLS